jgi:uncharacterized protein (DUF427 family)
MSNPAPGFAKHPNHLVQIRRSAARVRVYAGDVLIADTTRPLRLEESGYPPVWYLPMRDVAGSVLARSDRTTYCPFKGHASYWSIELPGGRLQDAVWGYETPLDECAALEDHVAFYPDRVAIDVAGGAGS